MESGFSIPRGYLLLSKKELDEITEIRKRLAGELLIADGKLEAVRVHLTKWVSGHSDWQMGRMSQWKKELDEILEAIE